MLDILEKLWFRGVSVHEILARSVATKKPRMDTNNAVSFMFSGRVIIIGEDGKII